jgi:tRNA(Ile)-lysidine synthase
LRKNEGYDKIAVAHHQDDAIETVLLNLTRGTGIAGLHGILPKKEFLVRPLLFLSRMEINQLIAENEMEFVEDSSNLSTAYARNKIRIAVIPKLKEINPNLEQTFEHNIQRFVETELVLQQTVVKIRKDLCEEKPDGVYLSLEKVKALHPQKLLLFEILRVYNFNEAVIEEILNSLTKQSGTSFYSGSHRLTVDRNELIITKNRREEMQLNKTIHPADTVILVGAQQVNMTYSDTVLFEKNSQKAFIDAEKLIFPLVLRGWEEGDRFMPLGMEKYKKLSDFFIDEKVPLPQKEDIPILVNGNGDIVWIVGLRQDNRYKVSATTKKVVIFEQKFN